MHGVQSPKALSMTCHVATCTECGAASALETTLGVQMCKYKKQAYSGTVAGKAKHRWQPYSPVR